MLGSLEFKSNFNSFLGRASARQELVVIAILMTAVSAMVLPITPAMADVLIALNIGVSVLLLMVAFYIKSPLDFAALPSVVLITTVFRLSISVATTRLILTEADGGAIIDTFGNFVIAGNVIVGLVVFLIITTVQFIVITKGSERVAEVAARFSLDGLPGKQISIDSDLRNGDIDQFEARRRRMLLEKESQLYGAMDGALKFVKGDAIAGIIIISVNLIGGIAIGTLQRGLSFNDSTHIFSLLTIGDGLIAQIPALFISLTAGTVVTRVSTEGSKDVGSDIIAQIASRPDAMRLSGVLLICLALVPGFPALIFLVLALLVGGYGILLGARETRRLKRKGDLDGKAELLSAQAGAVLPRHISTAVQVIGAPSLVNAAGTIGWLDHLHSVCQELADDLGFACPSVSIRADETLTDKYLLEVESVPALVRNVNIGKLYLPEMSAEALDKAAISYEHVPSKGADMLLEVDSPFASRLTSAGISFLHPLAVLEKDIRTTLVRNAFNFVGLQETRRLLSSIEANYRDLVREAQRVASITRIAEILKRLLEERVSIRNLRAILETIVESAPKEADTNDVVAHVRYALRRQINHRYADEDRVINAIIFERSSEEILRDAIQKAIASNQKDIAPPIADAIIKEAGALLANDELGPNLVVFVSADLRRYVFSLLSKTYPDTPVLAFHELGQECSMRVRGTIRLPHNVGVQRPASELEFAGAKTVPSRVQLE